MGEGWYGHMISGGNFTLQDWSSLTRKKLDTAWNTK